VTARTFQGWRRTLARLTARDSSAPLAAAAALHLELGFVPGLCLLPGLGLGLSFQLNLRGIFAARLPSRTRTKKNSSGSVSARRFGIVTASGNSVMSASWPSWCQNEHRATHHGLTYAMSSACFYWALTRSNALPR